MAKTEAMQKYNLQRRVLSKIGNEMKKKQEIQFFDFVIINSRLVLKTFNKDNGLSDLRSVDLDLFRIRIFY